MDHPSLPGTDVPPASVPEAPTGLDWQQFFQELGQGTQAPEITTQDTTPRDVPEKMLYLSENGDRWSLVRGTQAGRVLVRHRPNQASGGQSSDTELSEFLSRGGMGPEKQALLRLIGSIVDGPEVNA